MSETIRFLGKKILCEQTNLSKLQWQRRYLVLTTKAGRDENRLGFGAKVLHSRHHILFGGAKAYIETDSFFKVV